MGKILHLRLKGNFYLRKHLTVMLSSSSFGHFASLMYNETLRIPLASLDLCYCHLNCEQTEGYGVCTDTLTIYGRSSRPSIDMYVQKNLSSYYLSINMKFSFV